MVGRGASCSAVGCGARTRSGTLVRTTGRAALVDSGAVVGATREALAQVMPKAVGLNIAGKIGIAYCNENLAVAVLIGIGLMDLHDVAVGLGHRAVERVTEHS